MTNAWLDALVLCVVMGFYLSAWYRGMRLVSDFDDTHTG
jgi:hypothetical protein